MCVIRTSLNLAYVLYANMEGVRLQTQNHNQK